MNEITGLFCVKCHAPVGAAGREGADGPNGRLCPACANTAVFDPQTTTGVFQSSLEADQGTEMTLGRRAVDPSTAENFEGSRPAGKRGMELLIAIRDAQLGVIYTRRFLRHGKALGSASNVDGALVRELMAAMELSNKPPDGSMRNGMVRRILEQIAEGEEAANLECYLGDD